MQPLDVVLYRLDYRPNYWGGPQGTLYFREFKPLRATRTGWWVYDEITCRERIVYGNTERAFAYLKKELALQSFMARKRHYVARCRNRLAWAEEALALGAKLREGMPLDEVNTSVKPPELAGFNLGPLI